MRARRERLPSAPPARLRRRRSQVGWGLLCAVIEVQAQADAPTAVVLEKVVVTGSNIARYRQYAQLNWTYRPWGARLANNYQSVYSEPCRKEDPTGCITRRVGSYSVRDLQGRYTDLKNTTLTPGVRNALGRAPPLTNQDYGFQKGFDPSYADPRGRTFYVALNYAFQ